MASDEQHNPWLPVQPEGDSQVGQGAPTSPAPGEGFGAEPVAPAPAASPVERRPLPPMPSTPWLRQENPTPYVGTPVAPAVAAVAAEPPVAPQAPAVPVAPVAQPEPVTLPEPVVAAAPYVPPTPPEAIAPVTAELPRAAAYEFQPVQTQPSSIEAPEVAPTYSPANDATPSYEPPAYVPPTSAPERDASADAVAPLAPQAFVDAEPVVLESAVDEQPPSPAAPVTTATPAPAPAPAPTPALQAYTPTFAFAEPIQAAPEQVEELGDQGPAAPPAPEPAIPTRSSIFAPVREEAAPPAATIAEPPLLFGQAVAPQSEAIDQSSEPETPVAMAAPVEPLAPFEPFQPVRQSGLAQPTLPERSGFLAPPVEAPEQETPEPPMLFAPVSEQAPAADQAPETPETPDTPIAPVASSPYLQASRPPLWEPQVSDAQEPAVSATPPAVPTLFAGQDSPAAPFEASATPSKPPMPYGAARHDAFQVPEPIEVEEAEVLAPVATPPAEEILPTGQVPVVPVADAAGTQEPADPVRSLGQAAVFTAGLEAAGALTPRVGVPVPPLSDTSAEAIFAPESPFVPRFEPSTGATPTVRFNEPTLANPLTLSEIPTLEADEPAYEPALDLSENDPPVRTDAVPLAYTPDFEAATEPLATAREETHPFAPVAAPVEPQAPEEVGPPSSAMVATPAAGYAVPELEDKMAPLEPVVTTNPFGFAPVNAPLASTYDGLPPVAPAPLAAPAAIVATPVDSQDVQPASGAFPVLTSEDPASATPQEEAVTKKSGKARLLVLWILLGLVALGGIGYGVYRLFFWPEPEVLAVPTVTVEAPEPTVEPTEIAEPTDFLAAMPSEVATEVLTGVVTHDPATEAAPFNLAAEHHTLTYGVSATEATFTVEAYQHYLVADAESLWATLTEGATDIEDVLVGNVVVGQSAVIEDGDTTTVTWRNNTAVFVLTGPADQAVEFFELYGV